MQSRVCLMRVALVLLLAVLHFPSGAHGKALWAFVDSTMGFGDKMSFYRTLMNFAHSLNRTAILPPFQITVRDYSPLANADLQADGIVSEAGKQNLFLLKLLSLSVSLYLSLSLCLSVSVSLCLCLSFYISLSPPRPCTLM